MQNKFIKLAKRLHEFTLSDMVILTEIEESIIKGYLDEFVLNGNIRKKEGNRYVFLVGSVKNNEKSVIQIKLTDAINNYILENAANKKASTTRGYRIYANNHIIPYFKESLISEITPIDIVEFIKYLQNSGYTHRTVEHIFFFLKRVISNNDKRFKFPEIAKMKRAPSLEVLSEDDIKSILRAAKINVRLYPIVLGAVTTGLQLGEIIAVHWDDIDFENKRVKISKSILSKARVWQKPPSTSRLIEIPDIFVEELKKLQKMSPPNKHNAVFVNGAGNYHNTHNLRGRDLEKILRQSKINREVTFKLLQDSYAVMMIKKNMPLTFIQNQLGHKTVQFTADRYKEFLNTSIDFDFGF